MSTIFRVAALRLANNVPSLLCKPVVTGFVQTRALKRKAFLKMEIENSGRMYPDPYPIWKMYPTPVNRYSEQIYYKCNENSKLIVVEGPPAAGKRKVAEKLADAFGMLYMPPPTFDDLYIYEDGFDIRSLEPLLSYKARYPELNKFLKDPYHFCVPCMQIYFYLMRLEQSMNAVQYILSTGQGVVTCRSHYTDEVFARAMADVGYLSHPEYKIYEEQLVKYSMKSPRPHLVIYLDCTVDTVKKNIKKRNDPLEANSEAFTNEYLEAIERQYKEYYLHYMQDHSMVLAYDWNEEETNLDFMINDMEEINFDVNTRYSPKLADWSYESKEVLHDLRDVQLEFTFEIPTTLGDTMVLPSEMPERCWVPDADAQQRLEIEEQYAHQFPRRYRKPYEYLSFWQMLFRAYPSIYEKTPLFRRTPKDFINVEKSLGEYKTFINV